MMQRVGKPIPYVYIHFDQPMNSVLRPAIAFDDSISRAPMEFKIRASSTNITRDEFIQEAQKLLHQTIDRCLDEAKKAVEENNCELRDIVITYRYGDKSLNHWTARAIDDHWENVFSVTVRTSKKGKEPTPKVFIESF